jgi:lysyl-tRNA synthetase class 2
VRTFFDALGYLEVETPIRIPAPAPEAHVDAQPSGDAFLQTSPELCMKRLLSTDFNRIYQICKCFRRQERGLRHLPEMTLLEWYTVGSEYGAMMAQTESLVHHVAKAVGRVRLFYDGHTVDLSPPWSRMTVTEAFTHYACVTPEEALSQDRFEEILTLNVEPHLGYPRPTFLYDYPIACGALARAKPAAPHLAERFELYVAGMELCNGFTELNDSVEQRRRFAAELAQRKSAGLTVYPPPEPFLQALVTMPPAGGNALGLDRLTMLLAGADCIDEVVTFTPEEL